MMEFEDQHRFSMTEDSKRTLDGVFTQIGLKNSRQSKWATIRGKPLATFSGRRRPSLDKKLTFKEMAEKRQQIDITVMVKPNNQGQQFTKCLKDLGIDHRTLPINQAQTFLKKVSEIDKTKKDNQLSTSLREIKVTRAQNDLKSSYTHYKLTKEEEFQKEVQDAVSGQRHKKTVTELKDKSKIEEGKKSVFRLAQNSEKFFYERSANNVHLFKYSDYANDLVMAEVLNHLLVLDKDAEHRIPFLNNSNMPNISRALKRLLFGVETEMENIQLEKDRYIKVTGLLPEVVKDDKQHFRRVLKRSKFKDALLSSSAPPKAKEIRIHNLAKLEEELIDRRENWIQRK